MLAERLVVVSLSGGGLSLALTVAVDAGEVNAIRLKALECSEAAQSCGINPYE
jgi:hypothetical protein